MKNNTFSNTIKLKPEKSLPIESYERISNVTILKIPPHTAPLIV